ncbi:MAG TPA: hypothetical protein VEU30_05170 [Thermoanaerobaculia bacterium]|nr:hypothetical protein [Thermoanaerobaculia bacterium]
MKRFIRVADDFYPNPGAVRKRALSMTYTEPEHLVGWRTKCYQPRGIKERIEQKFSVAVTKWDDNLDDIAGCNGVFFTSYAKGDRGETVGIHYDDPLAWVMFLIYLTPNAPYDAGTSLWQHRATGLCTPPSPSDAKRLGSTVDKLLATLERDSRIRSRWVEIDRVGNVFNRAVMFPGGFYHSASRHFGSGFEDGRIYQSFHFPVRLLA